MNTGTLGVAPQDAGVAAATLNTGQQIGGSIGTSLLNTIYASAAAHYLSGHASTIAHGRPAQSVIGMSVIHGYTAGFSVAAAIFGAGALISLVLFRRGPRNDRAGATTRPATSTVEQAIPAHATA
jgi:hypothetical protein